MDLVGETVSSVHRISEIEYKQIIQNASFVNQYLDLDNLHQYEIHSIFPIRFTCGDAVLH